MTAALVHEFLPPPPSAALRVWKVTRQDIETGDSVSLGTWPSFTPEEALICACRYNGRAEAACTYKVEAFI